MKTAGCIIVIIILAINLFIGSMAFGFCVETFTGKRPSRLLCMVGGAVTGEIAMPLAVLLWILQECGAIHPPLLASDTTRVIPDRQGVGYVETF